MKKWFNLCLLSFCVTTYTSESGQVAKKSHATNSARTYEYTVPLHRTDASWKITGTTDKDGNMRYSCPFCPSNTTSVLRKYICLHVNRAHKPRTLDHQDYIDAVRTAKSNNQQARLSRIISYNPPLKNS